MGSDAKKGEKELMTGRTHMIGGCAAAFAVAIFQHEQDLLQIAATAIVATTAALFPDIDNRRSKIGARAKKTSAVIQHIVGHRTLFHSPILYLVLHVLGLLFLRPEFRPLLYAATTGIASHLLLDLCNKKGIPLLYPYTKHYHIACIRSGSLAEAIFAACLIVLTAVEAFILFLH